MYETASAHLEEDSDLVCMAANSEPDTDPDTADLLLPPSFRARQLYLKAGDCAHRSSRCELGWELCSQTSGVAQVVMMVINDMYAPSLINPFKPAISVTKALLSRANPIFPAPFSSTTQLWRAYHGGDLPAKHMSLPRR